MTDALGQPKKQVRVRFYRFRNRLKEKAAGLGAGGGKSAGFSKEALERAEAEFEKMAEDYPDWVGSYTQQLYAENKLLAERPMAQRGNIFSRINLLAHELKGQGGTFGYPLVSRFAESLYNFTGSNAATSDNHLAIVKAHIDAINAVIKGRVKGDGAGMGEQLSKELDAAIAKHNVVE